MIHDSRKKLKAVFDEDERGQWDGRRESKTRLAYGCAGGVHAVGKPARLHEALDSSDFSRDRGGGRANLRRNQHCYNEMEPGA